MVRRNLSFSYYTSKKFTSTFTNGLIVGSLTSMVVYFISSAALFSSEGEFVMTGNSKNFNVERLGVQKRSSDEENNDDEVSFLSDDTSYAFPKAKCSLLSLVPISWGMVEIYSESWKKVWWKNYLQDSVIILGTADESLSWKNIGEFANIHYAKKCPDFSSFSVTSREWWSPSQLMCLLEDIHSSFNPCAWSIILSAQTYLSVVQLKRILNTLNPGSVIYMGQPNPAGHCNGGPGIVLSRQALESIIPYLGSCLNGSESRGDVQLGRCFMTHLDTTCYDLDVSFTNSFHPLPLHACKIRTLFKIPIHCASVRLFVQEKSIFNSEFCVSQYSKVAICDPLGEL